MSYTEIIKNTRTLGAVHYLENNNDGKRQI